MGKPLFALRVAVAVANARLLNKIPPFRQIEIQLTYACNLRCTHCSAASFVEQGNLMSLEDYANIARQCSEHRVPMVSFTGGEPLLSPRLEEIIRIFDVRRTLISITTNGTLLTRQRARALKKAGVDNFVISLDGPDSFSNDAIRGEGVFEGVMRAIEVCKQEGCAVLAIHTLTHHSVAAGHFDQLIELARVLDIPLHVSLASPTGNWANDQALRKVILTKNDIDYLNKKQQEHHFLRRDLDGNYMGRGCPAGTERFVITPYGDVLPCTKIQASFGNVRQEPMLDIRNRMTSIPLFASSPPLCLCAEDPTYLAVYLPNTFHRKDFPIPYQDFFTESQ